MMRQHPTLVSVELGANEALGAASGLIIPRSGYRGVAAQGTIVPNTVWQPVYDQLIDSVKKTGAKVLLVECRRPMDLCRSAPATSFIRMQRSFNSSA